ncbi:MAG TPA: response regulator [Myxococcota bacterium]|nr:response regulator [Myxococcota bacterium]
MPKTLLLADDSITIQRVVGITFANEDYEITTVDNGDDAVIKAKEMKPDVILADVIMPKKNGYEVCQAVKQDPELKDIPVLLLAGTFEAFDENRAREVGANGHITKPFESQALIDKVNELVGAAPSPAMPSPLQPVMTAPTPVPTPVVTPVAHPPAAAPLPPPVTPAPATFIPEPRPLEPKPLAPRPLEPRPLEPRPLAPRPLAPRPLEPRPLEPRPLEAKPLEPKPFEPKPFEPKPFEPKPFEPKPFEPKPLEPAAFEPKPLMSPFVAEPPLPQSKPDLTEAPTQPEIKAPEIAPAPIEFEAPATKPAAPFVPPVPEPAPLWPAAPEPITETKMETLAELAQQTPTAEPIDEEELPSVEIDEEGLVDEGSTEDTIELAPVHEFIPKAEPAERGSQPVAGPGDIAASSIPREEIESMAREIIEKVVWEIVPKLAETILKEEIEKLVKDKLAD